MKSYIALSLSADAEMWISVFTKDGRPFGPWNLGQDHVKLLPPLSDVAKFGRMDIGSDSVSYSILWKIQDLKYFGLTWSNLVSTLLKWWTNMLAFRNRVGYTHTPLQLTTVRVCISAKTTQRTTQVFNLLFSKRVSYYATCGRVPLSSVLPSAILAAV